MSGFAQLFYTAPFYLVLGLGILLAGSWRALSGEMRADLLGEWLPWAGFMLLGTAMTYLAGRTLVARARARGREGVTVEATITGVELPDARDAKRFEMGWVATYTYLDQAGRQHDGSSDWMSQDEAQAWHKRGRAKIRIDPRSPEVSVWLDEQ
jgi:cytosine/adenosine deaminase-related metal-dependent hydrolase